MICQQSPDCHTRNEHTVFHSVLLNTVYTSIKQHSNGYACTSIQCNCTVVATAHAHAYIVHCTYNKWLLTCENG